ncbi:MAG: hypothetical protein WBB45_20660 [Cyclobacteriaceae bacterium]
MRGSTLSAPIAKSYPPILQGTILVTPDEREPYHAFYVRSQIADQRHSATGDSLADERLHFVAMDSQGNFTLTSPAKFIDLHPPREFAKEIVPPGGHADDEVMSWSFTNITEPQYEATNTRVQDDTSKRREYLETAFTTVIGDCRVR